MVLRFLLYDVLKILKSNFLFQYFSQKQQMSMVVSEKAVAMITEGTGTILITEDIEMIPGDHLLVIKKGTEEVHHQETDIGMDLLVKDLGVLQAIDLEDLQGTDQEDQMIG